VRISRIEIENWRCFRGSHTIDFDSGAHAIVARHETDPDRSNWLGKSTFLWAPRFAMTGEKPTDCRTEDDWITRGEDHGSVKLVLSDGTRIERTRKRGGPTVLVVNSTNGEFRKAEAQAEIERIVGLSDGDASIWFLAQKSFDRFVRARPGERAKEVSEWLRIEPLRKAEENVRRSLGELLDRESKLASTERADRDLLASIFQRSGIDTRIIESQAVESLQVSCKKSQAIEAEAAKEIERLEIESRKFAEFASQRERAAEREELAEDVERVRLEAERAAAQVPGGRKLTRLQLRARESTEEASRLRRIAQDRQTLARGEFDGRCPVGQVRCPITNDLNAKRQENATAAQKASKEASEARDRSEVARQELDTAQGQLRTAERAKERADLLTTRLGRMKPIDVVEFDEERAQEIANLLLQAKRRKNEARDQARDAETTAAEVERIGKRIEETVRELATIKDTIRTKREAVEILGRKGAQRRIAELALQEVEEGSNVILARAGIELSIRFEWDRETGGLATTCDVCGAPFPTSTRVRECSKCQAPRGPKIDERLDVVLSDVSGAAGDLAGLAISLAASERMRAERGSSWGVVCLDEPFGALDRSHRRSLSRGLDLALRMSWEQSLIIAHDDAVMDGLPNKIVIIAGSNGSRVERI
jgi:DNA repair exonuclease SbcCD ATPase subunit